MGQMTAGQVLAQVDDLLPNSYPGEQKRRWLRQAEGFVLEEVVRAHEGGEAAELPDDMFSSVPLQEIFRAMRHQYEESGALMR